MGSRGFTLMELAMVLAVIAIVGAIILPNFLSTTDRAKLRSDVQSARVLQSAADLYDAEHGTRLARTDVDADITLLQNGGYLSKSGTAIQTDKAVWKYDASAIKVSVEACTDEIKALAASLDTNEKSLIIGAAVSANPGSGSDDTDENGG